MSRSRNYSPPNSSAKRPIASNKAVSEVRIIGGQFKRQSVPFIAADGLRPSPDRLRETLFNWLQGHLHDTNVLDLCAGSGVLGLEALSRGAKKTTFIEKQPAQAALIRQTAEKLRLLVEAQYTVYAEDAQKVLPILEEAMFKNEIKNTDHDAQSTSAVSSKDSVADPIKQNQEDLYQGFHVVFIDPPYSLDLWQPLLLGLINHNLINQHTLIYIENNRPIEQTLTDFAASYEVIKHTKMGQVHANIIQLIL